MKQNNIGTKKNINTPQSINIKMGNRFNTLINNIIILLNIIFLYKLYL